MSRQLQQHHQEQEETDTAQAAEEEEELGGPMPIQRLEVRVPPSLKLSATPHLLSIVYPYPPLTPPPGIRHLRRRRQETRGRGVSYGGEHRLHAQETVVVDQGDQ